MGVTLNFNKIHPAKQLKLISAVIILLCFVLYGNSITNGYSVDDFYVTYENQNVQKGVAGLPDIFTSHHVQDSRVSFGYRPLVLTTFAIEYEIVGLNPNFSHFINILLYCLTCIILYYLLTLMMPKTHSFFPILTTLLFVIHPIHTEVVNNIKSRDELLCLLSGLSAMIFFFKFYDTSKWKFLGLGVFMIVLGLMSKLSIIVFFAVIPLALYFFRPTNWSKIIWVSASLLLLFAFLIVLKNAILPDPTQRVYGFTENPLFFEENFFNRIPAGFYILLYYIKLLFLPHPLSFYYGYDAIPIVGWSNVWSWVSILIHGGLGIFALYLLPRKNILAFGILYYLITISLVANIATPVVGIIADRFLYIPSIGFSLIISFTLMKLFKLNPLKPEKYILVPSALSGLIILLLVVSGIKILDRNKDWESELSLFENDAKTTKRSAKIHTVLASKYHRMLSEATNPLEKNELLAKAEAEYLKALDIYPYSSINFSQLGALYILMEKYKEARQLLEKSISLQPDLPEPYYQLALLSEKTNNMADAKTNYEKAIQINPAFYEAYSRLGFLYYNEHKLNEAVTVYKAGITNIPNAIDFYINLGNIYLDTNYPKEAIIYYELAYQLNPNDPQLLSDMAKAYDAVGNKVKAQEFRYKAIRPAVN